MRSQIVLGADPEIFVESERGANIPAFEFLPSKYEPLKTEEGMNYYWDGFQTEFNIIPSSDIQASLASIRYGLKAIQDAARKKYHTARLSTKTVIEVAPEALAVLPTEFTDFGCMPSYNIYDISGNIGEGQTVPHRFAGGHIHFGIGQQEPETMTRIVRALDSILGVACVSLFEKFDNPIRRMYYGLAGEFREPPHGLEYRVLSNAWLFDPNVAACVLDLSRKIVASALNNSIKWNASTEETVDTILKSDVSRAREILTRNKSAFDAFECSIDFMSPFEMTDTISETWSI